MFDTIQVPDRPREPWGGFCELVGGCTNATACTIHKQCAIERARDRADERGATCAE